MYNRLYWFLKGNNEDEIIDYYNQNKKILSYPTRIFYKINMGFKNKKIDATLCYVYLKVYSIVIISPRSRVRFLTIVFISYALFAKVYVSILFLISVLTR